MQLTEELLDGLAALQKRRLDEITAKGEDFQLYGSERSLRGIYDRLKSTITFPAGTPVHAGATLDHKTGPVYVATIDTTKAGIIIAAALPIVGTVELMTCKAGNYTRTGSLPILTRSAGELGVPAFGAPPIGSVIRSAGQLLKVDSARRDGPITVLRVQPVSPPKTAPVRASRPFLGDLGNAAPTAAPVRGQSICGW